MFGRFYVVGCVSRSFKGLERWIALEFVDFAARIGLEKQHNWELL